MRAETAEESSRETLSQSGLEISIIAFWWRGFTKNPGVYSRQRQYADWTTQRPSQNSSFFCLEPTSFRVPCSLGSLILDDDFPSGSQDIQANSWSLFHYEVVMRFQNIPKRSQELNLHLLVHDTVLFQSHVAHIK